MRSSPSATRRRPRIVARALVSITDITERKRAEIERERLYEQERAAREEAERMRAVAEAANRSKDEFLTMVSHELRSPLNVVLGYTRLLRSGPDDTAIRRASRRQSSNATRRRSSRSSKTCSIRRASSPASCASKRSPTDLVPAIEAALKRDTPGGRVERRRTDRPFQARYRNRCSATPTDCSRSSGTCSRTPSSSRPKAGESSCEWRATPSASASPSATTARASSRNFYLTSSTASGRPTHRWRGDSAGWGWGCRWSNS